MTTELIQVLDEEERRWAQTLYIEEFQSQLARSIIQVSWHSLMKSCFFFLRSAALHSILPEAEGGLGQINICEPVSGGKSGSLQFDWTGQLLVQVRACLDQKHLEGVEFYLV